MLRRSLRKFAVSRREAGFTLVELIAVMVILGLLAGIVTLGINAQVQKARVRTAITQISQLGQAISTFHLDCGFYPDALQSLISPPAGGRQCKGYTPGGYLEKKEIPSDPWGNQYHFTSPGTHDADRYDLWSDGPDGQEGTGDDVVSWSTNEATQEE
ncbi:MAG TPA: type II secretion system major pseudopilin GspG [Bdellovibrionota bacterium]|nr:type II secretion system major pseudopilin GspG [Bdellovibrionota bacterium]